MRSDIGVELTVSVPVHPKDFQWGLGLGFVQASQVHPHQEISSLYIYMHGFHQSRTNYKNVCLKDLCT